MTGVSDESGRLQRLPSWRPARHSTLPPTLQLARRASPCASRANRAGAQMHPQHRFAEFIADRVWTFAKTMPQWPHEYTVRRRNEEDPEFCFLPSCSFANRMKLRFKPTNSRFRLPPARATHVLDHGLAARPHDHPQSLPLRPSPAGSFAGEDQGSQRIQGITVHTYVSRRHVRRIPPMQPLNHKDFPTLDVQKQRPPQAGRRPSGIC